MIGAKSFQLLVYSALLIAVVAVVAALSKNVCDEGVFIHHEKRDPELTGDITVSLRGNYKDPNGDTAEFIAQFTAHDHEGRVRVVKTIFADKQPYRTVRGHFRLYSYFGANGRIAHDLLVDPQPELNNGTQTYRRRVFDADGRQVEEHHLRADKSLSYSVDFRTGVSQRFQTDGTTLKSEHVQFRDGRTLSLFFKRDGKTVWFKTVGDRTQVYFDLDGKRLETEFTIDTAGGAFSFSAGDAPKEHLYINYWRKDGTLEYRQTWVMVSSMKNGKHQFFEAVSRVTVYDASGKRPLREYILEPRQQGEPRFIKRVVIHHKNGDKLVRQYRAPGNRLSQEILDANDFVITREWPDDSFHPYREDVTESWFHAFGINLWGDFDDDDTHVIE